MTSLKHCLLCLTGLTIACGSLFSATIVSSNVDDGTEQLGTLSSGITQINTDASTSPIWLEGSSSPLAISGDMPSITKSLTISSNVGGSSRTIVGNGYSVLDVTNGTTSLTSEIILKSTLMQVSASSILSLTGGETNWNNLNTLMLNTGEARFSVDKTSTTASPSFNGTIILADDTTNTIYVTSDWYSSPKLIISGSISGSNAPLTFSKPSSKDAGFILNGTNTWTGGAILKTNLEIRNSNALPSSGPITMTNGSLTFALDSSSSSYTGNMDITNTEVGSGYIKVDNGNITLTGAIYGLNNADIRGGSLTLSGFCSVNTFGIAPGTLVTVTGDLYGHNGLTLNGSRSNGTNGTLSLFSRPSYTGDTSINQYTTLLINSGAAIGSVSYDDVFVHSYATLTNNGTVNARLITVYAYGTLNGSGVINGNIENSGSVNPGNSPGILTVNGDFESLPGSVLGFFITPTQSSQLDVTGSVTIDSDVTLLLNPEPACYSQQTSFDLITDGGGFAGTFSQVDTGSIFLTSSLSYSSAGLTVTLDRQPITNLGLEGNAKAVGGALNQLIDADNANACQILIPLFLLSQNDVSAALNQMQPALFKGLTIALESNAVKVREALSFRIQRELDRVYCDAIGKTAEQPCSNTANPFHVWINGIGNSLSQNSNTYADSPQVGYHNNMAGVVTGADYHFAQYFYAGILGAYTDTKTKWIGNQGDGTVKSGYGGLYFSALSKMFYGNASVIGAWNSFREHRNILLPVRTLTAYNAHGGSQLLSHADTGINLGWKGFTIRPFDSFDYVVQRENSFTESGAGNFDLSVKKSNAIMLRNELGLNFSKCFCLAKSQWTISPKVSWVREVRINGSLYTAEFAGTAVPFTVTGYFPNRSLVSPGINVAGSMLNDLLTIGLYYNGEFKGGYSDHSYGGEVRFGF